MMVSGVSFSNEFDQHAVLIDEFENESEYEVLKLMTGFYCLC